MTLAEASALVSLNNSKVTTLAFCPLTIPPSKKGKKESSESNQLLKIIFLHVLLVNVF